MATKKEVRQMFKIVISKFILQKFDSKVPTYSKISKRITELIDRYEDLDYILFSLQNTLEYIGGSFFITKSMELNIFQRLGYIMKIIEGGLETHKDIYIKEKNKIQDINFEENNFNLTTKFDGKYDRIDISKFL